QAAVDAHIPRCLVGGVASARPRPTHPLKQRHSTVIIVGSRGAPPISSIAEITLNIDPTLFQWTGVPFQATWHGFFTAVVTLVGIWFAVRWAVCAGYTEDDAFSVAMWGVIGAIIGARLFHVIDQWDFYAKDPIQILKINEGGLAIYGTIVGGPLAGALYAWHKKLNVARLADVAAPPLILGM